MLASLLRPAVLAAAPALAVASPAAAVLLPALAFVLTRRPAFPFLRLPCSPSVPDWRRGLRFLG